MVTWTRRDENRMEILSRPTPFTVFSLKYENRETAGKSSEYGTQKKGGFFSACIHGSRLPVFGWEIPVRNTAFIFSFKVYLRSCLCALEVGTNSDEALTLMLLCLPPGLFI